MDVSLLFPSRFLKSSEFQGRDVTLTVVDVQVEDLAQDGGGTKTKGVVSFRETKRLLVLNRTNSEAIKAMFGRETNDWRGKRLTLFPAPFTDPFGGDVTTCIRIRGSPDLKADLQAEIRLPRKKPTRVTLKKTGQGKAKATAPAQVQTFQKPPEPELPEPPGDLALPGEDAYVGFGQEEP